MTTTQFLTEHKAQSEDVLVDTEGRRWTVINQAEKSQRYPFHLQHLDVSGKGIRDNLVISTDEITPRYLYRPRREDLSDLTDLALKRGAVILVTYDLIATYSDKTSKLRAELKEAEETIARVRKELGE